MTFSSPGFMPCRGKKKKEEEKKKEQKGGPAGEAENTLTTQVRITEQSAGCLGNDHLLLLPVFTHM